ncbi:MAG: polyhydroxyalkanoate synthesis regulator DNA-binding domain-containing protein [Bdellovibrio sp.]
MEIINIKKYGNRRFYSSKEKAYVTLQDITTLIQKGQRVQITSAETDEDITSEVLTQILLEQGRASRFPVELLEQMIRLNEKSFQAVWTPLWEQNVRLMEQMGEVALTGLKFLTSPLSAKRGQKKEK